MNKAKSGFSSTDFEDVLGCYDTVSDAPRKSDGSYDVVIVGGGISGLGAALKMEGKSVLLLDQNNQMGGNARLENWEGLRFASAGTCLQSPRPGSETAELLKILDIWDEWQVTNKETLVMFDTVRLTKCLGEVAKALIAHPKEFLNPDIYGLTGKLLLSLLIGKKYISASKKLGDPVFSTLYTYLDRFLPGTGKYPALPWNDQCGWDRHEMELFDSISLYDLFFDKNVRKNLPDILMPKGEYGELVKDGIATTLRVECSTLKDVSAYVGLYFLISYLYSPLITFPGGNGFISERLYEYLEQSGSCTLKTNTRVTSIESESGGYRVNFKGDDGNHFVVANSVIWAAPKYVALDVIRNIPEMQRQAMKRIQYHDYCIANVFLKQPVMNKYFGGYVLEENIGGKYPEDWCRTGACLSSNWMDKSFDKNHGVLTLLKPVALDDEQGKLEKVDFKTLQQSTLAEITDLLQTQGIPPEQIEDIKIWRWQRGLVVCKLGQLKDDLFVRASKAIGGIFFANQDSVGVGNLESAVWAGFDAARQAREFLSRPENIKTAKIVVANPVKSVTGLKTKSKIEQKTKS